MATLSDIRSTNWQLSLYGAGLVAEGLSDIRQCIDIILRTVKGSDALRPQFGSDIYQFIDKPVNAAAPNIRRAIIEAIEIWEKRVKIVRITHKISGEQIQFFIYYSLIDEDVTDEVQLYLRKQDVVVAPSVGQQLILQGFIPASYEQLLLELILDGVEQLPQPPANGFSTPAEMHSWAINNWGFLGACYLLPDKLMLFMNNGQATTGSINITALVIYKYVFALPDIEPGQQYEITAIIGDTETTEDFDTIADVLAWLTSNYSANGDWQIEAIGTGPGDFSAVDFDSTDFHTMSQYYQVALYSRNTPAGIELEIEAV